MKRLLLSFSVLFSTLLTAGQPVCHSASGGYCSYSGFVSNIYVNKFNDILVYFDTAMENGAGDTAGYTVNNHNAAILNIDESPEFAKLFYSTALAAQSTKRRISIQMRGVKSGYLKIDRIWLSE